MEKSAGEKGMLEEKATIRTARIVTGICFAVSVVVIAIGAVLLTRAAERGFLISGTVLTIVGIVGFAVALVYFIASFFMRVRTAQCGQHEILVYGGMIARYLKVDGEIVDEYRSAFTYTPIVLSAVTDEGDEISVTLSPTNFIALKINGKLIAESRTAVK